MYEAQLHGGDAGTRTESGGGGGEGFGGKASFGPNRLLLTSLECVRHNTHLLLLQKEVGVILACDDGTTAEED